MMADYQAMRARRHAMRAEHSARQVELYKELDENLPPELAEELAREMVGGRRRLRDHPDDPICTESTLEGMIRSNILNREVARRLPPPPELERDWQAHCRLADFLAEKGVKIINVGNKGYPDLLFEVRGEVFAAEVKGEGDSLKAHQERVIDALGRLKRVFVVREAGMKARPDEVTLEEFLSEILK